MDHIEALKIVSRVKASTSNADVLAVCEIAEKLLTGPKATKTYDMSKPSRAAYMRDYRARKKGSSKAFERMEAGLKEALRMAQDAERLTSNPTVQIGSKEVGLDWKLGENSKEHLAEIDKNLKLARLREIISGGQTKATDETHVVSEEENPF